jgi:lipopolysaccharide assembly protein A
MKSQWIFLLGILFAIIVSIFAVINVYSVTVNYLFGTAKWPLILVILGAVLMGGFIVFSINAVKIYTLKRKIKQLERIIDDFEQRPVLEPEVEKNPETDVMNN